MLYARLLASAGAAGQYPCLRHTACRRRDGRDRARRAALGRRVRRSGLGARRGRARAARAMRRELKPLLEAVSACAPVAPERQTGCRPLRGMWSVSGFERLPDEVIQSVRLEEGLQDFDARFAVHGRAADQLITAAVGSPHLRPDPSAPMERHGAHADPQATAADAEATGTRRTCRRAFRCMQVRHHDGMAGPCGQARRRARPLERAVTRPPGLTYSSAATPNRSFACAQLRTTSAEYVPSPRDSVWLSLSPSSVTTSWNVVKSVSQFSRESIALSTGRRSRSSTFG